MRTYEVSPLVNGKSVGFVVRANSAADAIAIAKAAYGSDIRVFGAKVIG